MPCGELIFVCLCHVTNTSVVYKAQKSENFLQKLYTEISNA